MIIHSTSKVFDHIEIMLRSLYENNPKYTNTVFVLGYIDIKNGISEIRSKYPNKQIIPYQLEQLFRGSRWVTKQNIEFLREADEVWDYDQNNIQFLYETFNIHARFIPMQYVPQLSQLNILPKEKCDIDVLFYGSMNTKRSTIVNSIRDFMPMATVISTANAWDNQLDDYIQRSKIVLNLHYYDNSRLEQARIFYLLANHKCVVSETSNPNYYGSGIMMCKGTEIPKACKYLIDTGEWYEYANKAVKTLILSNYTIKGWN